MFLVNKGLKIAYSGTRSPMTIGRSADSDLRLNYPTISKCHVRLLQEDDAWIVEDQGSVNLTYLNGINITGRHPLKTGDYLRLDIYTLVFFTQEPPQLPEIVVQDPSSVIRHRLPLTQTVTRIGRNLVSNHIAIDDPRVSGIHLVLERQDRKWLATPAKPEAGIRVNQIRIDPPVTVHPGDKVQIGNSLMEISAPIVREWNPVSQALSRLQELHKAVRMQARTIEDAMHENFPAARGEHEWITHLLEVLTLVAQHERSLEDSAEKVRVLMPSMETYEADMATLNGAIRDSRRCTNLANYLDLVLRNDQLVRIQNADLALQRDLIRKLRSDVQSCIETDNPTLLLK